MKKILILIAFICLIITTQAQVKPSQLPSATTLTGTEYLIVTQGGVSKKVTPDLINSYNSIDASTIFIRKADSAYQKPGSYTSRYDFKTEVTWSTEYKVWNKLGARIGIAPACPPNFTTLSTMVDNRVYYTLAHVPDSCTIDTLFYNLSTAGVFTGDGNFNGMGIYSISGGTATKLRETANSEVLWKITANTLGIAPLTSAILLPPGNYFIAAVYNSSAQTTAPAFSAFNITGVIGLGVVMNYDLRSAMYLAGDTLPASFAISTASGAVTMLGIIGK